MGIQKHLGAARVRTAHAVRAIRMVWAAAPGLAAGWFALLLAQGADRKSVV